jgi:hypothetical protein
MPPKVDWPAAHGTDNRIAIKNEETLLNIFESPYSLARDFSARSSVRKIQGRP